MPSAKDGAFLEPSTTPDEGFSNTDAGMSKTCVGVFKTCEGVSNTCEGVSNACEGVSNTCVGVCRWGTPSAKDGAFLEPSNTPGPGAYDLEGLTYRGTLNPTT
jgi:hypothetical protein